VGVSKQDWKDYQANTWTSGQIKTSYDELMQAFDALYAAIDGGDAATFMSYTEDDGKLMQAAQKASSAASDAVHGAQALALEGNQRRFANKQAISTCDAAIAAVDQYHYACDLLTTGLVRGVRPEYESVSEDNANMQAIKSGGLKGRLESEQSRIRGSYEEAQTKVAALAAIDKIGLV
jgi:hypothetical protein